MGNTVVKTAFKSIVHCWIVLNCNNIYYNAYAINYIYINVHGESENQPVYEFYVNQIITKAVWHTHKCLVCQFKYFTLMFYNIFTG